MNMKNLLVLVLLIVFTAGMCSQEPAEKKFIKTEELKTWVSYLASDQMKGRANGSDEMKDAAYWLADRFNQFGIQPFDNFENYIQEYSFTRRSSSVDERNVIGKVEGSDPDLKNEYIIVSAHFDHIGIRSAVDGDSIYNGADDNAAGTATLLGVAKALNMMDQKPGRTIIFAAVSGEEMGMQGSRYFASNPPVSLSNVYANINFEMTGHSEELGKGNYYMTGCSYSNLDDLINQLGPEGTVTMIDTLAIADRLFFASDNISFSRLRQEEDIMYGIPSGTFVTSSFAHHVHKPIDEVELFDLENMADLVNYFSEMLLWLSNCEKPVEWTDSRFKRNQ
jgi:hypothetical protein